MNADVFPYVVTRKDDGHEIMVIDHKVELWVEDRVEPVVLLCSIPEAKRIAEAFKATGTGCDVDVTITTGIDLTELEADARAGALCQQCMERYAWAHPNPGHREYSSVELCRPCDDVATADYYGLSVRVVKSGRDEMHGPAVDPSNVR